MLSDWLLTVPQDEEMVNKFQPSLMEADVIKEQHLALDYIGIRGSIENAGRVGQQAGRCWEVRPRRSLTPSAAAARQDQCGLLVLADCPS